MLGELSGEDKSDRSLDLSRRDGRSVVVRSELGSLGSDSLEDVRDERVQDGHGLVTDTLARTNVERVWVTHEIPVSGWTCLRTL